MTATTDTPARAAIPPWRQRAQSFWRWWSAEVVKLVPERLSGFAGTTRSPLVLLEGDTLVVVEARGTSLAELTRVPLGSLDLEGRRIAMRNLLAEAKMRVRLCLAREEGLLRRVSLPLATEENLAQVISFEMDRLSPFRAEDVYFGCRITGRDPAAGKLHLDLAVARRPLVDERVQKLNDWGVGVAAVVLADDAARAAAPIDVQPEARRADREAGGARRAQLALVGGVLALFVLVLAVPIWQKRETVLSLMPALAKAKTEAEATDALAKELERNVADYNFLLSKKHATQPVLAFIEELSRLLPDATWVQTLEVRPVGKIREIQITGETTSSSKLIEIFEQSTTMRNAAPRGSLVRGSQPGTERFMIAAEAKPRALPEPVAAVALATASPAAAPAAGAVPPVAPSGAAPPPGAAPAPATPAAPLAPAKAGEAPK